MHRLFLLLAGALFAACTTTPGTRTIPTRVEPAAPVPTYIQLGLSPSPTIQPPTASPVPPTVIPQAQPEPPTVTPQAQLEPCEAIQNGLTFLAARYNPETGLLNEAPVVAPDKYWLTNDNALAAYVLKLLGETGLSAQLQSSLKGYGFESNGFIEVLWGLPIGIPPYPGQSVLVTNVGDNEIWQEAHVSGDPMQDWAEYANLAFLGVLNHELQGRPQDARQLYQDTLLQFDGTGFRDRAFHSSYETYKLAMAIYTGEVAGLPNSHRDPMLAVLLSMQNGEGGFFTHYQGPETPVGDANTETTSWSLLAINETGCMIE